MSLSVTGVSALTSSPLKSNPKVATLDFETVNRSGCDLKKAGAWRYAADPATEVLTLTYHVAGEYHLWTPEKGLEAPLAGLAADPTVTFIAHNTGFEQAVWQRIMVERHRFPAIPIERWCDTMAVCAYHAVPLALDKALEKLNLPVVKDAAGRRLTLSLSRPHHKTGAYPGITPKVLDRVAEYNRIDVEGTVAIDGALGRLPKRERWVWELDQQINQRGVGIDLDFVRAAKGIADRLLGEAVEEFRKLTDLNPSQVEKVRGWLRNNGCELDNLRAEKIEQALKLELSPEARRVLEIRAMAASASLKKLDRMLASVEADSRARGLFQYHVAITGRFAARGIQPQNFPRPTVKIDDPEELVAAIKTGDANALRQWGEPIEVLVSSLRHAVLAQGDAVFGCGDFTTIEARNVLALAGQEDKVALLGSGVDVYRIIAAEIFKLDEVTKATFLAAPKDALTPEQAHWRHVGKSMLLGCGFGLGTAGFGQRYEVDNALAARTVDAYRKAWAPRVPALWYDLERTALRAMRQPSAIVEADCGIRYRREEKAGVPFLVCQLLDGKKFHYINAAVEERETPWGDKHPAVTYWTTKGGIWRKVVAWHGHLTENVVQATARELLVEAMLRFEARGFPVVMHTHDEIVIEHPEITPELMQEIMTETPAWAEAMGLPVAVEAWVGRRYRK